MAKECKKNLAKFGFSIIELLVIIVVIGILTAIVAVSYSGVTGKTIEVVIQSDLSNAKITLVSYKFEFGSYPTALDASNCPSAPFPDTTLSYCLKPSSGNSFSDYTSDGVSFGINATDAKGNVYHITSTSEPKLGALPAIPLSESDPANWIAIGTQVWARYNLNVGELVTGTTAQTNNGGTNKVEKYCYGNTEAGCTATDINGIPYGGLYQWGEAMGYAPAPTKPDEFVQGICPSGSHIPSDDEWQTLEIYLGMQPGTNAGQAGATGYRGTDQGTQLKSGGTSGLNIPLAGSRTTGGSFNNRTSYASLWSSSESGANAWGRVLNSSYATVSRNTFGKANGFSVRCLGN